MIRKKKNTKYFIKILPKIEDEVIIKQKKKFVSLKKLGKDSKR